MGVNDMAGRGRKGWERRGPGAGGAGGSQGASEESGSGVGARFLGAVSVRRFRARVSGAGFGRGFQAQVSCGEAG
ncbi:hypothetical protein JCM4914_09690 [Streptomyces platensis subsp. malvinus]